MQTQRIAMRPKANNAAIDAALLGQPLAAGALTTADLILMAARANAVTGPLIGALIAPQAAVPPAVLLLVPIARRRNKRPRPPGSGSEK